MNGMLRSIARHRDAGTLPKLQAPAAGGGLGNVTDVADTLGVQFSHPSWMVERWLRRFGLEECVQLLLGATPPFLERLRGHTKKFHANLRCFGERVGDGLLHFTDITITVVDDAFCIPDPEQAGAGLRARRA